MKKLRLALILIFICIFGIYFFHNSFAADSTVAKEKGGKITASDKKSSSHPTTEISMTCSECHEVDYDAKSTATRMWINNYKQMTRDEIWKKKGNGLRPKNFCSNLAIASSCPYARVLNCQPIG